MGKFLLKLKKNIRFNIIKELNRIKIKLMLVILVNNKKKNIYKKIGKWKNNNNEYRSWN